MTDATDIEKRNLEAHVELCAERYRFLEKKLETLDGKIEGTNSVVREVHDMIQEMGQYRNKQILAWGVGIVGTLVGTIGYLMIEFVLQ